MHSSNMMSGIILWNAISLIAADVEVKSTSSENVVLHVSDATNSSKRGIKVDATGTSPIGLSIYSTYLGIESNVTGDFWDGIYAGNFTSSGTNSYVNSYGIIANANTQYSNSSNSALIANVYSGSAANNVNYALTASSYGSSASTVNYALYASTNGDTTNAWAGYFDGKVVITGNLTWGSDIALKQNVRNLDRGLDKILALQPKAYEMKGDVANITTSTGTKFGLIAQDVQSVLPELVESTIVPDRLNLQNGKPRRDTNSKSGNNTILTMDYTSLIPVLVQAIQEQQAQISALKLKVQHLENDH